MRSLLAFGLMTLTTGIPLCARQNQSGVKDTGTVKPPEFIFSVTTTKPLDTRAPNPGATSSGFAIELPPLISISEPTATKPKKKVFSSGFVIEIPDFVSSQGAK